MSVSLEYLLIISEQAIHIYTWVVFGVLCQIINVFGIVTNIINIICFVRQGFEDSVNISLLGLAVSDLGSLVTMICSSMFIIPAIMAVELSFDAMEVAYLASAIPHFSFTRVSSCITAMITLERCLCITAPLKMKSRITPKRTTIITICVFIIFFVSNTPVYAVNRLGTKFSEPRNTTIFGLISTKDRETVEIHSFFINNFIIPFVAFIIISVCTTILSIKLREKSAWRQKTITTSQIDRVTSRNQKAAKMVVMISILFIACFVPLTIIVLALAFVPALSIHGKYMNFSIMISGCGYMMESLNSSVNIFIYYNLSSKYRQTFCDIFFHETTAKSKKR